MVRRKFFDVSLLFQLSEQAVGLLRGEFHGFGLFQPLLYIEASRLKRLDQRLPSLVYPQEIIGVGPLDGRTQLLNRERKGRLLKILYPTYFRERIRAGEKGRVSERRSSFLVQRRQLRS